MILVGALALLIQAAPAAAEAHAFVLTGAGRFAVLADLTTRRRTGEIAEIRSLQLSEEAFVIGDKTYVGGWSNWRFNCAAKTADRLDFASLRDNGVEGPITPEPSPAYEAAPGGDAAELLAVACASELPSPEARSLEDAIRLGRAALAGDLDLR